MIFVITTGKYYQPTKRYLQFGKVLTKDEDNWINLTIIFPC